MSLSLLSTVLLAGWAEGERGHPKIFLPFALLSSSPISAFKVLGGGGGVGDGPSDYCISPRPKNWVYGFFRLDFGSDLGTWLDRGLGLVLYNYKDVHNLISSIS